jgi:hypothetical protein
VTARSAAFAANDARPARAAALWIALLVALASSLLSSGPPRSVAFGSAFTPQPRSMRCARCALRRGSWRPMFAPISILSPEPARQRRPALRPR